MSYHFSSSFIDPSCGNGTVQGVAWWPNRSGDKIIKVCNSVSIASPAWRGRSLRGASTKAVALPA
ncbi:MAG TPA: hypothetical protein VJ654_10725 [Noviherbaspirillum sp.]|nr:hypothetical protein [Noviherbaspirillum sp.]